MIQNWFVPYGILAARFVPVFRKKLSNFSAIDFLSVISSLAIIKLLGKESFYTLNFPMIDFMIFQVFLMLFSHFFNLFWKYNFFNCFFSFSHKFLYILYASSFFEFLFFKNFPSRLCSFLESFLKPGVIQELARFFGFISIFFSGNAWS